MDAKELLYFISTQDDSTTEELMRLQVQEIIKATLTEILLGKSNYSMSELSPEKEFFSNVDIPISGTIKTIPKKLELLKNILQEFDGMVYIVDKSENDLRRKIELYEKSYCKVINDKIQLWIHIPPEMKQKNILDKNLNIKEHTNKKMKI